MSVTSTMPRAEAPASSYLVPEADHVPPQAAGPDQPQQGDDRQADRALHAMLARLTGGISPVALLLAYTDWLSHLAASPQRQVEISQQAVRDAMRFFDSAQFGSRPDQRPWSLIQPQPQDR